MTGRKTKLSQLDEIVRGFKQVLKEGDDLAWYVSGPFSLSLHTPNSLSINQTLTLYRDNEEIDKVKVTGTTRLQGKLRKMVEKSLAKQSL